MGDNLKWVVGGIVAVGAAGWWYNTQSSFVELNDGVYDCRAVHVNQDDKYQIILTTKGKTFDGTLKVEGGKVTGYSAPQKTLKWSDPPDLSFENKGRNRVRVTDRHTYSRTRYALACDHKDASTTQGFADTPSTSRPERDSAIGSKRVRWDRAIDHIGENQTVCGPLVNTGKSNGGAFFLNLGRGYPDPKRFQIVLWNAGSVNPPRLGQTLCATGQITQYEGVAQIMSGSASDFEVLK